MGSEVNRHSGEETIDPSDKGQRSANIGICDQIAEVISRAGTSQVDALLYEVLFRKL